MDAVKKTLIAAGHFHSESEQAKAQSEGASGASIHVPPGMDPAAFIFSYSAEDRLLHNLAQAFCDQAIKQGKQDEAIKAIAELIADQGVTHGAS